MKLKKKTNKLLSSQFYPKKITTKVNHLKPRSVVYYNVEGNSSPSPRHGVLISARKTVHLSGFPCTLNEMMDLKMAGSKSTDRKCTSLKNHMGRHRHPFSYNSTELGWQQTEEKRVRARKMRLQFPGNRGKGLI